MTVQLKYTSYIPTYSYSYLNTRSAIAFRTEDAFRQTHSSACARRSATFSSSPSRAPPRQSSLQQLIIFSESLPPRALLFLLPIPAPSDSHCFARPPRRIPFTMSFKGFQKSVVRASLPLSATPSPPRDPALETLHSQLTLTLHPIPTGAPANQGKIQNRRAHAGPHLRRRRTPLRRTRKGDQKTPR